MLSEFNQDIPDLETIMPCQYIHNDFFFKKKRYATIASRRYHLRVKMKVFILSKEDSDL